MKTKLRTLFMGTPPIVIPVIKALYEYSDLLAIFTGPDKPGKRGKKLFQPSPATYANETNIPLFQPNSLKNGEIVNTIQALQPDLLVVYAYGFILPESILSAPRLASINYHASLLPKYRGASPIQAALMDGASETGISIQKMVFELDAGPLIYKEPFPILWKDTFSTLMSKTSELFAKRTPMILSHFENNTIKEKPQDHSQATFCKKIKKEDGIIDWSESNTCIFNKIRAFDSWPQCYTFFQNKRLKILQAIPVDHADNPVRTTHPEKPGTIIQADKKQLVVQTGDGLLALQTVQPENKKPMDYKSYINGYPIKPGALFNNG